jgi:DNA polymerase beta
MPVKKKLLEKKPKIKLNKLKVKIKSQFPIPPPGMVDLRIVNARTQKKETVEYPKKQRVINILNQLIDYTKLKIKSSAGDDRRKHGFRISQFKKAVNSLEQHQGEISSGAQAKKLKSIGPGIAKRIDEIINTGTLTELGDAIVTDQETKIIRELAQITGIGDITAKKLCDMGVTGIEDLKQKVSSGEVEITHHTQIGLKYYDEFNMKIPYDEIKELKQIMINCIRGMDFGKDLLIEVCGSHRRGKAMSGDIDVLICHPEVKNEIDLIMSQTHYLKDIVAELRKNGFIIDDLTSQGDTKYMGVCMHLLKKIGRRIDIRFVPYDAYYATLLYFTGSMTLNKLMRNHALDRGYTLNEYGLFTYIKGKKGDKVVAHSEKEIFDKLGIVYLTPEQRELN